MLGDVSVRRWGAAGAIVACALAVAAPGGASAAATRTLSPSPVLSVITGERSALTPACELNRTDPSGSTDLPIAAVCDGPLTTTTAPGPGITLRLTGREAVLETVGRGYRSYTADIGLYGDGLRVGDSAALPATRAPGGALVWVRSGDGGRPVALQPGSAATVRVQRAGRAGTTVAITRDGQTTTTRVNPVRLRPWRLSARVVGKRVQVSTVGVERGTQIGFMFASRSVNDLRGVFKHLSGAYEAVTRKGRTTERFRWSGKRPRTVVALWLSPKDRLASLAICRLPSQLGGRVTCRGSLARRGLPAVAGASRMQQRRQPAQPRATRQAAPEQLLRSWLPLDVPKTTITTLARGDLNNDGHAELLSYKSSRTKELRLSTPAGGLTSPVRLSTYDVASTGDVDGDARSDVLLDSGRVVFGTGQWSDVARASEAKRRAGDSRLMTVLRVGEPLKSRFTFGPDDARALPDVDGDGRPELGVLGPEAGLILPSSVVRRGAVVRYPRVTADAPGESALADVRSNAAVDAGGFDVVQRVNESATNSSRTTVVVTRIAPDGTQQIGPPIEGEGTVSGFARDALSGDRAMDWRPTGSSDDPRTATRVSPTGTLLLRVTGAGPELAFGPDGPDADTAAELYLTNARGQLVVASSEIRGSVSAQTLPVVTNQDGLTPSVTFGIRDYNASSAASLTVFNRDVGEWQRILNPAAAPAP